MPPPLILLTNDDGVHAPGLDALYRALLPLGDVQVYAPDQERSAVGHGISLHQPLRLKKLRDNWHMVSGTPADCVLLAVRKLLGRKPSLVVSGINNGANLGDDVTYSGTVAGAREAMLLGLPAIAVSNVSYQPTQWETCGAIARLIAQGVLDQGLPEETLLNVNIPDLPLASVAGLALTSLGKRVYDDEIIHRKDPRGGDYFWIGGATDLHSCAPGTDLEAIALGKVSVTPIQRDATRHEALQNLFTPPLSLTGTSPA